VLEHAHAITACSQATIDDLELWFGGGFGDRGRVVPNGIRLQDFCGPAEDRTGDDFVLALGRLVHQKGFDVLLRAYALAAAEPGFAYNLVIAGGGTEMASLSALARELGIARRVRLVGPMDRAAVIDLVKRCAFVTVPSRLEPFGLVNLEAMAAGKAVLATRVGGIPEVVSDGRTGLLVAPDDPTALAREMLRLARDAALRDELGAAGRRAAVAWSWERAASAYLATYADALRLHEQQRRR
jgi:glycosyltransferase involved in cell wall biosynthesis